MRNGVGGVGIIHVPTGPMVPGFEWSIDAVGVERDMSSGFPSVLRS